MTRSSQLNRRLLVSSLLALPGCTGLTQQIGERPLRAADTHPADYPTAQAVAWLGNTLSERTNGRLRITNYTGGQLGQEKDTLEIVIFGGLDINRVNLGPLNSVAAETVVPNLPFLFRSVPHMRRAMDGPAGDAILASLEPHGMIGLCFYDSGARNFYNTRGPVRTPDDLRGLKIRVQNSDVYVAMVEALGADATPMGYGEVYQGLVQGVVDGAENNWPSYDSSRHFESAKYISETQHVMGPDVLLASSRTWGKLSPGDRDLLRATAKESVSVMRGLWETREAAAEARMRAAGVQIETGVDRAAFEARMEGVYRRFVRTSEQRRLVSMIRNA